MQLKCPFALFLMFIDDLPESNSGDQSAGHHHSLERKSEYVLTGLEGGMLVIFIPVSILLLLLLTPILVL